MADKHPGILRILLFQGFTKVKPIAMLSPFAIVPETVKIVSAPFFPLKGTEGLNFKQ
jgi:hypothetical protein